MNPIRPAGIFAVIAGIALGLALCAHPIAGTAQQQITPIATGEPSAPSAPSAPSEGSGPPNSPTPHVLRPVIFVQPTPWKYGKRLATPRPATKRRATSKLAPNGAAKPASKAPAVAATSRPRPVPTDPAPAASQAPTPTPTPVQQGRRDSAQVSSRSKPSPAPTLSPTPTQSGNEGTILLEAPSDTGVPTPIPTQPPTPRPLAPNQPTIPDSMSDPNVRGIIARPIRQLSQIGWMQGTWNVTGVTNKEDGSTVPRDPTTYVFSPIMQNRWMFGADGRATDYIYLTFDPFARHWVALRFGDNPNYGMWQSEKGWIGNRIDFVTNFSYVNGRQYRRRLTIIHKDARTFGIYETEQTPDGSFIPDDAYEFKKI